MVIIIENKSTFLSRYDETFAASPESLRSADMAEMMYTLCAYLDEERVKYNLTAIKDPAEVMSKHVYDCLIAMGLILDHAQRSMDMENISYIDIGSGAGFPALPAAALLLSKKKGVCCRSAEASLKKCGFMNRAAALMGLPVAQTGAAGEPGFSAVQARAEELGRDPLWREKYDIVTARAVADLPVLMELCLPLTRVGGIFAAMKGSAAHEELLRAKNAARLLGAKAEAELSYSLPGGAGERTVLIFRKTAATGQKYPRSYGKISAKPL